MSTDFPTGRFVWYDLMTPDPQAAITFYTTLIGWGTQPFEGAEKPYMMWTRDGMPLGGVIQLPEEAQAAGTPAHWLSYVAVPDTDAYAKRAVELGGSVMVPAQDIPTVGRFAVITDPQGGFIALYTPANEVPGHDGPAEAGTFSWHELMTTDHAAACDFYVELFGWKKGEAMDMGEAGIYQMYGRTEMPLGGMFTKPATMPGPPGWLYYIRVPDVHQAAEKVKEMGGQVVNGPIEVPGGDSIVQCMDPQGGFFAMHHLAAKS